VPSILGTLSLLVEVQEAILVQLLGLLGADDTDLIIFASKATARVADWVDMQFGGFWLARELAKPLSKLFLELIV